MIITLYTIKEINNGVSLLSFENKTERDKFFNSLTPVYKTSLDTLLLDSDSVLLDKPYYSLYKCNYAKINDTDNNIVIYAYIDVTQYTNTEVSRVTYTVDNITTYMYDDYRLIGSYKRRHLNRFLKDGSINIEDFRYEEDTNLTATKEDINLLSDSSNLYLCVVATDKIFDSFKFVTISGSPGMANGYITFIFPYGATRDLWKGTRYTDEIGPWANDLDFLLMLNQEDKKTEVHADAIKSIYLVNIKNPEFINGTGYASNYLLLLENKAICYTYGKVYDHITADSFEPFREYETNEPKLNLYPFNFTKFKYFGNEFTFERQYYKLSAGGGLPYFNLIYSMDENKSVFMEFNNFTFEYYEEGGALFNIGLDTSIAVSQLDYRYKLQEIASWQKYGANVTTSTVDFATNVIGATEMSLVNPVKASEMTLGATSNLLNNTINGAISTGINNAIEKNRLANLSRVSIGNGNNLGALYGKLFIPQLVYYSLYDYQIKEMEAYFDLFGYSYKAQFNYNSRLIEDNRTRTYYNYVQASAFNLFIGLNQSNKNDIITRFMNGINLYHVRDNKIMNESKGDSYNEEYNFIYDKTTYQIFINDALTYSGEVNKVFSTKADASKYFYSLYPDMNNYLMNFEIYNLSTSNEGSYHAYLFNEITYKYELYLNDSKTISSSFTSDKILTTNEVETKILELNPDYSSYLFISYEEEILPDYREYKIYYSTSESLGETEIKDVTEELSYTTDNVITYVNNLPFKSNREPVYFKLVEGKTFIASLNLVFYDTDGTTELLNKSLSYKSSIENEHRLILGSGGSCLNTTENKYLYFGWILENEEGTLLSLFNSYLTSSERAKVTDKKVKIILNSITEVDS